MHYELIELEDGSIVIGNGKGFALPIEFLDMVFELESQNPTFYKAWVELAANYTLTGSNVLEA